MGIITERTGGSLVHTTFKHNSPKRLKVSKFSIIDDSEIRENDEVSNNINIISLPVEILFKILSYFSCRDLYTLKKVNTFFERLVSDPTVWKVYEVRVNFQ